MTVRCAAVGLVFCAVSGLASSANASLINRGGGLIYDSDRNITWLSNANYGAGSAYDDGISNTDGRMTWASADAWAASLTYFDSVRGVTYDDWRLPSTPLLDASCSVQQGFSFGSGCTGSELGHLFSAELGGTAPISSSADPDLALFANLQDDGYWSNEFDATSAQVFNFLYGLQGPDQKALGSIPNTLGYFALAVRSGDVAAPEPAVAWLLGVGLVAGAWRARRR